MTDFHSVEEPTLVEMTKFWLDLSCHWRMSKTTFSGQREDWVCSLGFAVERLQTIVEELGLEQLKKSSAENPDKALELLNSLPCHPGKLTKCRDILTDKKSLLELKPDSIKADNMAELAKHMAHCLKLCCFDQGVVEMLLPQALPELQAYVENTMSALKEFIDTIDTELADWRELIAKYRQIL